MKLRSEIKRAKPIGVRLIPRRCGRNHKNRQSAANAARAVWHRVLNGVLIPRSNFFKRWKFQPVEFYRKLISASALILIADKAADAN